MQLTDNVWVYEWTSFTQNNANTYVLGREGKVLIDPGHSHLMGHVRDGMAADGLDPDKIEVVLATHSHPDHFEGVEKFLEKEQVKIGMHADEEAFVEKTGLEFARMMGLATPQYRVDFNLAEGDLQVDGVDLQIFHTPGHSPGHICIYWPEKKVLFSGDLIFNQGVGRTDFPGGDGILLKESIKKMAELDIEYILSGHGPAVSGKAQVEENFKFLEQVYFPMI